MPLQIVLQESIRWLKMDKFWLRIEKHLGAFLLRCFSLTIRKSRHGEFPTEPVVFILWHRDQIPLIFLNRNRDVGVLVSKSKDGELIAGPISKLGFVPIRGSSSRGGSKAMRDLIRHLETNSIAITPDGPKGPAHIIKDGALMTAYLTGRAIVPVAIDVSREWTFNSWDKFRFPKPFSHIRQIFGMKIFIDKKEDIPEIKERLAAEMGRLYEVIKFK